MEYRHDNKIDLFCPGIDGICVCVCVGTGIQRFTICSLNVLFRLFAVKKGNKQFYTECVCVFAL